MVSPLSGLLVVYSLTMHWLVSAVPIPLGPSVNWNGLYHLGESDHSFGYRSIGNERGLRFVSTPLVSATTGWRYDLVDQPNVTDVIALRLQPYQRKFAGTGILNERIGSSPDWLTERNLHPVQVVLSRPVALRQNSVLSFLGHYLGLSLTFGDFLPPIYFNVTLHLSWNLNISIQCMAADDYGPGRRAPLSATSPLHVQLRFSSMNGQFLDSVCDGDEAAACARASNGMQLTEFIVDFSTRGWSNYLGRNLHAITFGTPFVLEPTEDISLQDCSLAIYAISYNAQVPMFESIVASVGDLSPPFDPVLASYFLLVTAPVVTISFDVCVTSTVDMTHFTYSSSTLSSRQFRTVGYNDTTKCLLATTESIPISPDMSIVQLRYTVDNQTDFTYSVGIRRGALPLQANWNGMLHEGEVPVPTSPEAIQAAFTYPSQIGSLLLGYRAPEASFGLRLFTPVNITEPYPSITAPSLVDDVCWSNQYISSSFVRRSVVPGQPMCYVLESESDVGDLIALRPSGAPAFRDFVGSQVPMWWAAQVNENYSEPIVVSTIHQPRCSQTANIGLLHHVAYGRGSSVSVGSRAAFDLRLRFTHAVVATDLEVTIVIVTSNWTGDVAFPSSLPLDPVLDSLLPVNRSCQSSCHVHFASVGDGDYATASIQGLILTESVITGDAIQKAHPIDLAGWTLVEWSMRNARTQPDQLAATVLVYAASIVGGPLVPELATLQVWTPSMLLAPFYPSVLQYDTVIPLTMPFVPCSPVDSESGNDNVSGELVPFTPCLGDSCSPVALAATSCPLTSKLNGTCYVIEARSTESHPLLLREVSLDQQVWTTWPEQQALLVSLTWPTGISSCALGLDTNTVYIRRKMVGIDTNSLNYKIRSTFNLAFPAFLPPLSGVGISVGALSPVFSSGVFRYVVDAVRYVEPVACRSSTPDSATRLFSLNLTLAAPAVVSFSTLPQPAYVRSTTVNDGSVSFEVEHLQDLIDSIGTTIDRFVTISVHPSSNPDMTLIYSITASIHVVPAGDPDVTAVCDGLTGLEARLTPCGYECVCSFPPIVVTGLSDTPLSSSSPIVSDTSVIAINASSVVGSLSSGYFCIYLSVPDLGPLSLGWSMMSPPGTVCGDRLVDGLLLRERRRLTEVVQSNYLQVPISQGTFISHSKPFYFDLDTDSDLAPRLCQTMFDVSHASQSELDEDVFYGGILLRREARCQMAPSLWFETLRYILVLPSESFILTPSNVSMPVSSSVPCLSDLSGSGCLLFQFKLNGTDASASAEAKLSLLSSMWLESLTRGTTHALDTPDWQALSMNTLMLSPLWPCIYFSHINDTSIFSWSPLLEPGVSGDASRTAVANTMPLALVAVLVSAMVLALLVAVFATLPRTNSVAFLSSTSVHRLHVVGLLLVVISHLILWRHLRSGDELPPPLQRLLYGLVVLLVTFFLANTITAMMVIHYQWQQAAFRNWFRRSYHHSLCVGVCCILAVLHPPLVRLSHSTTGFLGSTVFHMSYAKLGHVPIALQFFSIRLWPLALAAIAVGMASMRASDVSLVDFSDVVFACSTSIWLVLWIVLVDILPRRCPYPSARSPNVSVPPPDDETSKVSLELVSEDRSA